MAEGGLLPGVPSWRAESGAIADFATGPTRMSWVGQDILYGEALSPGNREYRFQDVGSMCRGDHLRRGTGHDTRDAVLRSIAFLPLCQPRYGLVLV